MPDINGMSDRPALSATSEFPAPAAPAAPAAPKPVEPVAATTSDDPTTPAPAPIAEPDDSAPARSEPDEPTQPSNTTGRVGERLSQLAKRRDEALGLVDRLSGDLAKAIDVIRELTPQRAAADPQPQPVQPPATADDPRPKRDQFADPDSYDAAIDEWHSRVATRFATTEIDRRQAAARAEETTRRQAEQQATEAASVRTSWLEKRAQVDANPDYADFDAVAHNPQLPIPESMALPILHAPNGPQVLYHLGKHPEEAARIAKLAPLQQVIEIGRLSAAVENGNRPPARRLPQPIEPVASRNNADGEFGGREPTAEEWAAKRNPQIYSERRPGMWGSRQGTG